MIDTGKAGPYLTPLAIEGRIFNVDFVLEALTALSAVAAAQPVSDKRKSKHPARTDDSAWWPPFEPDPIANRKSLPISRLVQDLDQKRFRA